MATGRFQIGGRPSSPAPSTQSAFGGQTGPSSPAPNFTPVPQPKPAPQYIIGGASSPAPPSQTSSGSSTRSSGGGGSRLSVPQPQPAFTPVPAESPAQTPLKSTPRPLFTSPALEKQAPGSAGISIQDRAETLIQQEREVEARTGASIRTSGVGLSNPFVATVTQARAQERLSGVQQRAEAFMEGPESRQLQSRIAMARNAREVSEQEAEAINRDVEAYNRRVQGFKQEQFGIIYDPKLVIATGFEKQRSAALQERAAFQETKKTEFAQLKRDFYTKYPLGSIATERTATGIASFIPAAELFGASPLDLPAGPGQTLRDVRRDRLLLQSIAGSPSAQKVLAQEQRLKDIGITGRGLVPAFTRIGEDQTSRAAQIAQERGLKQYTKDLLKATSPFATYGAIKAERRAALTEDPIKLTKQIENDYARAGAMFAAGVGETIITAPEELAATYFVAGGAGKVIGRGTAIAVERSGRFALGTKAGITAATAGLAAGATTFTGFKIAKTEDPFLELGRITPRIAAGVFGAGAGARSVTQPKGPIDVSFQQTKVITTKGVPRDIPFQDVRTADIVTKYQQPLLKGTSQVQINIKPDGTIVQKQVFPSGKVQTTTQLVGGKTATQQIDVGGKITQRQVAQIKLEKTPVFKEISKFIQDKGDITLQTPTQTVLGSQKQYTDFLAAQKKGFSATLQRQQTITEKYLAPRATEQDFGVRVDLSPTKTQVRVATGGLTVKPVTIERGLIPKDPSGIQIRSGEGGFVVRGPQSGIAVQEGVVTKVPSLDTRIIQTTQIKGQVFLDGRQVFPKTPPKPVDWSKFIVRGKKASVRLTTPELISQQKVTVPQFKPASLSSFQIPVIQTGFVVPTVAALTGATVGLAGSQRIIAQPRISVKTSQFQVPTFKIDTLTNFKTLTAPAIQPQIKPFSVTQQMQVQQLQPIAAFKFPAVSFPKIGKVPAFFLPPIVPPLPGGGRAAFKMPKERKALRKGPTRTIFQQTFGLDLSKVGKKQAKGVSEITGVSLRL